MKRLLSFTLAALAIACIASQSQAAGAARAPREIKTVGYTSVVSSVTAFTVLQATSGITVPGAVYSLILSTGAAADYVVLLDTTSGSGYGSLAAQTAANVSNQIGPHYMFGSTTANTTITFDPPVYFFNGLFLQMSSNGDVVGVEYETGRGLAGQ